MKGATTWTAGVVPAVDILTVREAVRSYLEARRLDLAESSVRSYANVLRDLTAVLGNPPVHAIDTRLFRRYFVEILERDYKRSTISHRYEICSGFFDWLVAEGSLESNPAQAMKSPKQEKRLKTRLQRKMQHQKHHPKKKKNSLQGFLLSLYHGFQCTCRGIVGKYGYG